MTNESEFEPFTFRGQKDLRGRPSRPFQEKERQWAVGADQFSAAFSLVCLFFPTPSPSHPELKLFLMDFLCSKVS